MFRLQDILESLWVFSDYSWWKMLLILGAAALMIALAIYLAMK